MRCSLTRVLSFHARHRYHKPAWSEAENARRFGWTSAAPGHGHLYRVEVTVAGPLDPDTQMVIDLPLLDTILTETVAAPLAGRHLAEAVPTFAPGAQLPTCEAIAAWCFARVAERLPADVSVERVLVAEDATLWAECRGPA
ncbi:MAG: 6-carboxytetrahydropterin synthase [Gemmatimonadetes bacterium]|nr:6-carboxytetrahydropterin synthase [Gemmatimonadota bacterium]